MNGKWLPFVIASAGLVVAVSCGPATPTPIPPGKLNSVNTNSGLEAGSPPFCETIPILSGGPNVPVATCPSQPAITIAGTFCSAGIEYVNIDVAQAAQPTTGSSDAFSPMILAQNGPGADCPQTLTNGLIRYTCPGKPPDTAKVSASLDCTISVKPSCPAGYQYDPNANVCNFTGTKVIFESQCNQGDNYDPVKRCCDAGGPTVVQGCGTIPPGAYDLWNTATGQAYCVTKGATVTVSNKLIYDFNACSNPKSKPPSVCKPPPYCNGPQYQWNQNSCTCDYVPG